MSVVALSGTITRALVIEQLNVDQWHVVLQGADVPAGSWEGRATGCHPFAFAAKDALEIAETTGLPVLVEAYLDERRSLAEFIAPTAFPWCRRYGHSQLADLLAGRGAA